VLPGRLPSAALSGTRTYRFRVKHETGTLLQTR